MLAYVIQLAAFGVLAGVLVYLWILVVGGMRSMAVAGAMAEAEKAVLAARVSEIMDRRRIEVERVKLSWEGFRKFEVVRKVEEGGDICSFYLRPHDARDLPPFAPGQYLTFRLDIPDQVKPVIRCYSLSDSPRTENFRVSIKKIPPPRDKPDAPPGLSSTFFHDRVNEGDILDVKAPGGHFYLDTTRPTPVVLIGGGVGITPVLSMLNQIVDSGSKRETWFFYGVRNKDEHVMQDHLRKIADENDNVHLRVCYSDAREGVDVEGRDHQVAGRVSVDLFKELLPSNNYDFYFCGPPPMMNALFEGLRDWGVPEDRIHYEAFGPATVQKKKEADDAAKPADAAASAPSIDVTFDKTGKTVAWDADAGSLLDFAEANGVAIDFGCRAGNCGTCITAIKSGDVDYLSEPGDPPETGSCLSCICVPKENLVVDA